MQHCNGPNVLVTLSFMAFYGCSTKLHLVSKATNSCTHSNGHVYIQNTYMKMHAPTSEVAAKKKGARNSKWNWLKLNLVDPNLCNGFAPIAQKVRRGLKLWNGKFYLIWNQNEFLHRRSNISFFFFFIYTCLCVCMWVSWWMDGWLYASSLFGSHLFISFTSIFYFFLYLPLFSVDDCRIEFHEQLTQLCSIKMHRI